MRFSIYPLLQLAAKILLLASVPLLVWQDVLHQQIVIAQSDFLAAHSMMETFVIIVSALIFSTGYGAHETLRSVRSVILSYAFLAAALFDIFHFLSYAGMPDLVGANSPHKAILFGLCSRFSAGAGLLAYVMIPEAPLMRDSTRRWGLIGLLLGVGWLSLVLLSRPALVPAMFVTGQGLTSIKIAVEWLVCGLYLTTAALLFPRRRTVTNCDVESLLLALLLMAAGELFFTLYVQVSSTANLIGHSYKIIAYFFLYRAIYAEAVRRPFHQMRHMLTHDDLTGLPNRAALNDQLKDVIMRTKRSNAFCAAILMDLDCFQKVNDTLGHEYGDLLLVAVAERIRSSLPAPAFLARFSGDEFVILLEETTLEYTVQIGASVLQSMKAEFRIGDDRLEIGASLGIVTYPTDGESASVLMRHADLALHRAKLAGGNGLTVFSRDLAEEIQRRVSLETQLKQALQRGEFSLHYQPKVDLSHGRIVGWEALLRWQSPNLGLVSPVEFIPIAEQTGLIRSIGDWVLREACRQVCEWRAMGLTTGSVAVNLSTRQFRQKDLAQAVQSALEDTGLPPSLLELEITESAIMDNLTSAAAVLAQLERLGIHIAVDDFGTGHSSLSYLKTFSIHCLKIDRSFIHDIPGDESDAAIVRTIIALAGSLGLTVVAEGVESEDQLLYLRNNRCDQMQGYFFSTPLPPAACVELMRSGKQLFPTMALAD